MPVRQPGASRRPPRACAPRSPWRAAPRCRTAQPKRPLDSPRESVFALQRDRPRSVPCRHGRPPKRILKPMSCSRCSTRAATQVSRNGPRPVPSLCRVCSHPLVRIAPAIDACTNQRYPWPGAYQACAAPAARSQATFERQIGPPRARTTQMRLFVAQCRAAFSPPILSHPVRTWRKHRQRSAGNRRRARSKSHGRSSLRRRRRAAPFEPQARRRGHENCGEGARGCRGPDAGTR